MLEKMSDPVGAAHHREMEALLDHVTELLDWDTLIGCYVEGTNHTVMLPWYYVPKLVAHRMVHFSFQCGVGALRLTREHRLTESHRPQPLARLSPGFIQVTGTPS